MGPCDVLLEKHLLRLQTRVYCVDLFYVLTAGMYTDPRSMLMSRRGSSEQSQVVGGVTGGVNGQG
jgi:hypothetical protein